MSRGNPPGPAHSEVVVRSPSITSSRNHPLKRSAPGLVTALLIALPLAACSRLQQEEPSPLAEDPTIESSAPTALDNRIDLHRLVAVTLQPEGPSAAEEFLDSLPEPHHVEEEAVMNIHSPGEVDTVETRYFQSATIEVYRVSATGKELISSVRLTGDTGAYPGVRVGEPLKEARSALTAGGATHESTPLGEGYLVVGERAAPHLVILEEDGDVLSALQIHAYLD